MSGRRPKPQPKGFLKKVLWNLKNFRKNERVHSVRSSFAHLSPKERCVYNIFCIKTHLQVKLIIVTFLLTAKSEYIFAPQKALFLSNLRKISKLKRNKKFHKNTSKRILHKNRRRVFSLLPFSLGVF